jgi:hypothetical protein
LSSPDCEIHLKLGIERQRDQREKEKKKREEKEKKAKESRLKSVAGVSVGEFMN